MLPNRATLLHLITCMPMLVGGLPFGFGIDDWAIWKGSRTRTILVDLDCRRVIDLCTDRTHSRVHHLVGCKVQVSNSGMPPPSSQKGHCLFENRVGVATLGEPEGWGITIGAMSRR